MEDSKELLNKPIQMHGRVIGVLTPRHVQIHVNIGIGMLDGGRPMEIPEELVPFELRLPNTDVTVTFENAVPTRVEACPNPPRFTRQERSPSLWHRLGTLIALLLFVLALASIGWGIYIIKTAQPGGLFIVNAAPLFAFFLFGVSVVLNVVGIGIVEGQPLGAQSPLSKIAYWLNACSAGAVALFFGYVFFLR